MNDKAMDQPAETCLEVHLLCPIPEKHIPTVTKIYEEAFGQKFSGALWRKSDRLRVIEKSLDVQSGFVAVSDCGNKHEQVLGVVGFEHHGSSFTGKLNFSGLIRETGLLRGLWASLVFSLFGRKPQEGQLVLDGIAVSEKARGLGIGTKLLQKIIQFAELQGYRTIRLDVIGDNEGAKRLYERVGFEVKKTESFAFLRPLIGFSSSSEMILQIQRNKIE